MENAAGSHVYVNVSTGSKVASIVLEHLLVCCGRVYHIMLTLTMERKEISMKFGHENVTGKTELPFTPSTLLRQKVYPF